MEKNVKKNYIYNVSYQILTIILPILTAPYVARTLGAENTGIHSFTTSVANFFLMFAMLGLKNYGNRRIAQVRDDRQKLSKEFCNIYFLQFIMTSIVLICYGIYCLLPTNEYKLISFIQAIHIIATFFDVTWFFFGLEEFKTTALRNIVIRLLGAVSIFIFVNDSGDLKYYTLIINLSTIIGFLVLIPKLFRLVDIVKPSFSEVKSHIKPCLLLFIPVVAVSIFQMMDKIMLGRISDMTQLGYYENTEKLMRIPLGIITTLGTVMMPRISNMIAKGQNEKTYKLIEQSMIFAMGLACALTGGLAGIGKVFAPLFFGDEFIPCGELIMVLAPTILSLSWANVIRMQYLIPNKMDKEFTVSTIIGAVVNLIANLICIPRLGAMGAVIGTLCAETSLTVYQTYVVRKSLPIGRYLKQTVPFVVIGSVMSAAVYFIGEALNGNIGTLIIQICCGICIYMLLVVLYFCFSKQQGIVEFKNNAIVMVNGILHRKKR